ncbi:MAG: MATE family efflux transporter [Polyangiaceae bacterium]|nr:MATE family efflux transporter [Polyangiaceae bacterium]
MSASSPTPESASGSEPTAALQEVTEPPKAAKRDLTQGPVGPTLTRLAIPMAFGIGAVILFGVVDTIYVGQLGPEPLAAMSFTFPIVFTVMSLSMGMGIGVMSVISRAIGEGDDQKVTRLATHGLMLAFLLVVMLAAIGLLTLDPLFAALGAGPELMPMIKAYMVPWYLGVGLLVVPMVGNACIRATGDTKTPGLIMMLAGGVNVVLDPLMIFGIGPFPRWELMGAAVATVISWMITFVAAFWILTRREKMLSLSYLRPSGVLESWKHILTVGLPAAATNMLVPIAAAVLTRIASRFGHSAVAAYGVGTRVESLSMIGIIALSASATPFAGQNFGARKSARIREALKFGAKACVVWGLGVALVLGVAAPLIAGWFSSEGDVITPAAWYMRLVPISYGAYGVSVFAVSVFNGINRPLNAGMVIVIRLFVLAVPLALLGAMIEGLYGMFLGVTIANVIIGGLALVLVRAQVKKLDDQFGLSPQTPG